MNVKVFFIATCLFFAANATVFAQSNAENNEVKSKVAKAVEQLDAAFKFDKAKRNSIQEIFTEFYQGQQKLRNDIQRPASSLTQGLTSQNFQSVRKKNEELITERDKQLKKELSDDEYKKWKGQIEPSLHSNRKNN